MDAQGVPHDLGVLSHYDVVLWYTGENRISQDPENELIRTPFGQQPDIGVAERQQSLTMAVRDFLNAGGKLVHAGESVQHQGLLGISDVVGGLYYGLDGDPSAECLVQTIEGYEGEFGGPVTEGDNPLDEAGVFQPTGEVLLVEEFPQFASQAAADYLVAGSAPPVEGERYAGVLHEDASWTRLTRTIDLTTVTAAAQPKLEFQLSLNSETNYDHLLLEARTTGQDDWTTLPDLGGETTSQIPSECVGNGFR